MTVPLPTIDQTTGTPFTIKRGDTRPAFLVTLKDGNGNPINLTGCSVTFVMKSADAGDNVGPVITSAAAIPSPTSSNVGQVSYNWAAGDTYYAGNYWGEFKVNFTDGSVMTFPNTGYLGIVVWDDLEN